MILFSSYFLGEWWIFWMKWIAGALQQVNGVYETLWPLKDWRLQQLTLLVSWSLHHPPGDEHKALWKVKTLGNFKSTISNHLEKLVPILKLIRLYSFDSFEFILCYQFIYILHLNVSYVVVIDWHTIISKFSNSTPSFRLFLTKISNISHRIASEGCARTHPWWRQRRDGASRDAR